MIGSKQLSPTWVKWLGVNLLFATLHLGLIDRAPRPLVALLIGVLLILAPSSGWSDLFGSGSRSLGSRLTARVVISLCAVVSLLTLSAVLGTEPSRNWLWNAMWAVTNLGFLVVLLLRRPVSRRRVVTAPTAAVGALLFLASFATYFFAATRVVPEQVDHDLEVQATGYGLLTRFEPLLLTDRSTTYYFAHPPMLHILTGVSFLYYDAFPELEFYDAASRRARDAEEGRPFQPPVGPVRPGLYFQEAPEYRVSAVDPPNYTLEPISNGSIVRAPIAEVELRSIYERYLDRPYLLETRTPNLLLAAATVALLGIWAARISHRLWMGLLAGAAYGWNPEVFVRSSYGGYFAIGAFATILMLLSSERWAKYPNRGSTTICVISGAFAAFSDHKLVLVPAAAALWMLLEPASRHPSGSRATGSGVSARRLLRALHPLAIGFGIGMALYWCYGLVIDRAAFVEDHLQTHLFDRLIHRNPLGYSDYPAVSELWMEFQSHTGYLLLPVFLILATWDLWQPQGTGVGNQTRGLWLIASLMTAVAFTLIDWRQTKHLVPILIPVFLSLVPERWTPRWRVAIPGLLFSALIFWNVSELRLLTADFSSFPVTPAW